jgi:integrase/recombinase XerD
METIQWEHYPYVAENSHARTWLEMQVKLCLADNTIKAYGRSANDYLAFCQRARIAFVEATKADIVLYIDDMLQRSNPRGENICYLHLPTRCATRWKIVVLLTYCCHSYRI